MRQISSRHRVARQPRGSSSYTLVELIIAVSVIGIIINYAVPGFRGMINQAKYNRSSETLAETLSIARNEAIFNGKEVIVCASDDPAIAEPVCSGDQSNWSNGWIAFQNCNNNFTRQESGVSCDLNGDGVDDSAEPIVKTFPPTSFTITNISNTAVGFLASGIADPIADFTVSIGGSSGTVSVSTLARIETSSLY